MDLDKITIIDVSINDNECLCDQFCTHYVPEIFSECTNGGASKANHKSQDLFRENKRNLILAAGMCSPSAIKLKLATGETMDGCNQELVNYVKSQST